MRCKRQHAASIQQFIEFIESDPIESNDPAMLMTTEELDRMSLDVAHKHVCLRSEDPADAISRRLQERFERRKESAQDNLFRALERFAKYGWTKEDAQNIVEMFYESQS